ncbi:RloB family protein [Spongiactinospora sp. TRM90649]|uniref:RloB family protein n=1 Tax=Spongiactinospora sp. TRM90649 TaxID=3031114 RepID=UPI0023F88150|nr:RloB family protein [Spongiactinospora sp. TRM90649]MDF5756023.1 RloB family protein [Spongiactinospora sp. TRM90649]
MAVCGREGQRERTCGIRRPSARSGRRSSYSAQARRPEPHYIGSLKRLPEIRANTSAEIEIDPPQGVPLTLARRAVDRSRDDEVDECRCVFDVEWPLHPNREQAVHLAGEHGIKPAISNPCFELWLILHFEDQTGFLNTYAADRRSRHLDGRSSKRIAAERYNAPARHRPQRADQLTKRHVRNETQSPDDNPSSSMSALIRALGADRPPAR